MTRANRLPPPIVWTQALHKRYQEKLCYLLIRLTRPDRARLGQARNVYELFCSELRESIRVEGLSLYSLLGRSDVLIRAWCNEEWLYKLSVFLDNSDIVVESITYVCRSLHYLWASQASHETPSGTLAQVTDSFVTKVQKQDSSAIDAAIKADLLLGRPERPQGGSYVKFFCHIPLAAPQEVNNRDNTYAGFWDEIRDGVTSALEKWAAVLEVTITVLGLFRDPRAGRATANANRVGPAAVMIKGLVPGDKLCDILPFTFAFSRCTYQLLGASETLIVAQSETDWRESDAVTVTTQVRQRELEWLRVKFALTASEVVRLDPVRCIWVREKMRTQRVLVRYEEKAVNRSVYLTWLRAYLVHDNEQAFRTLSIVMKAEGILARLVKKYLGKKDRDWYPRLISKLFAGELSDGEASGMVVHEKSKGVYGLGSPREYTLPDWINILCRIDAGRLCNDDRGAVSSQISHVHLDALWELVPDPNKGLRGWRNMYAHGDLLEPLPKEPNVPKEFVALTDFVAKLTWLMYGCERILSKL